MSEALTYHGVEVPVWEIKHGDDLPAGLGWIRSTTENGVRYTLPCWRRPHPWRVMLEGRGCSSAPTSEETIVAGLREAVRHGISAKALERAMRRIVGESDD